MGRTRKHTASREKRAGKKAIRHARLEGRVIVAEASAQAAETRAATADWRAEAAENRVGAIVDATAETARLRAEASAEAARIMDAAHAQADYVVAQARVIAAAQTDAACARAELQAERLQTTATIAFEQARSEARAERERAVAELTEERNRLRDQALLEAARLRDDALATANAEVAAAETERDRILADAHAEAFAIVERARSDAADHEIWEELDPDGGFDAPSLAVDVEPAAIEIEAEPAELDFFNRSPVPPTTPTLETDLFGNLDPPPFELTPLAVTDAIRPTPDPVIVDLANFWQDKPDAEPDQPSRHRLRRRARRS